MQLLLVHTILLLEAADTSAGVDDLLLTGQEGVALGAHFHADVLFGGAGGIDGAAGTANGGLLVIGMNTCSHDCSPLSNNSRLNTPDAHPLLDAT